MPLVSPGLGSKKDKKMLQSIYNQTMLSEDDAREVISLMDKNDDFEYGKYRFISKDAIDAIQVDELKGDLYILGCFNAWFLAVCTDIKRKVIDALQKAEAFEALGELLLPFIDEIQKQYAEKDGYGHHFAHYDHKTIELDGWYAFRID